MQRQTYLYIHIYIIKYIHIILQRITAAGYTYPGRGEKVASIDRLAIYHTTPAADAILTYTVVATNLQILNSTV